MGSQICFQPTAHVNLLSNTFHAQEVSLLTKVPLVVWQVAYFGLFDIEFGLMFLCFILCDTFTSRDAHLWSLGHCDFHIIFMSCNRSFTY
ncbi:hypothetical protein BDV40DRAFT_42416 [Aspergillus tamarii]|uniref:Uncharacterized protein n=1 Tax=Aspergillus tamarii TaxID=41984 RepID=A0A5N6UGK9_ASPTM|nr:hypothetical protein BDV40DRAFT_42416 [Aspergillus tamarii]